MSRVRKFHASVATRRINAGFSSKHKHATLFSTLTLPNLTRDKVDA